MREGEWVAGWQGVGAQFEGISFNIAGFYSALKNSVTMGNLCCQMPKGCTVLKYGNT